MNKRNEEAKEDRIFLAALEDKFRQCSSQYRTTYTGFLDLRQKSMAEKLCRELCKDSPEVSYCFFGGYEEAERTVCLFFPDYETPDTCHPLQVLRVKKAQGGRALSHRDYLGALTGLGVKREMIGDILPDEEGADLLILEEICEFLLLHYDKAGSTSLAAEAVELNELCIPKRQTVLRKDTVASLRLDNVVASAFSLPRAKAAAAIGSGLVFLNGLQAEKTDMQVKEGDKLVLRGKGKAFLRRVGSRTRKDRIFIETERYV